MEYKTKSIELLNKVAQLEIGAILQYLYYHFHFSDRGYAYLSKLFLQISMKEMNHLDSVSERILYLGGDVIMKPTKPISYLSDNGKKVSDFDVNKILEISKELELNAVEIYNQYAVEAASIGDSATKRLIEELVADEEDHENTYSTELQNFTQFGDNYLAIQSLKHMGKGSK